MNPNLKPCPFCGTNDALNPTEGTTFRWVRIECGCGAVGPEARRDSMAPKDAAEDFRRAAKEWNERKP
jgi:Lar family restriction alleviation protein